MIIKTKAKPLKWMLAKLHIFRFNHFFITPKEGRNLIAAYAAKCKSDLKEQHEAFKDALFDLQQIRSKTARNTYEIKIWIDRDSLETRIGEKVAIADISMQIARLIVERHQKHKKPACQNSDTANTKPNSYEPNNSPEVQTARQ